MSKPKQPRSSDGKFSSFQPEAMLIKSDLDLKPVKTESPSSSEDSSEQFVRFLKMRSQVMQDSAPLYRPSDNIFVSASGITTDSRPFLDDLWALANIRCGPFWFVTHHMSGDCVRNWHQFVDPDSRKPEINDTTKAIHRWAIKSDLRNQAHQLLRKERGLGTSFLVKHWKAKEKRDDPPPKGPPRKFRAFSPRYMSPINTNQSNELDYDAEVWRFSGGIFADYGIHQDRVHVLSTRGEEGNWRGLSVFEPVWLSSVGYMQSFIYLVRKFRQWGSVVPAWYAKGFEPVKEVATKYLDLMKEYEFQLQFVMNNEDKLVFHETQIGKGVKEAFEQYKEDMSSCWRVPLNQLFGRSMGGGLAGAGALVSKEDLLQEESNIQMSLTDDFLKIYSDAGWEIEQWDLEWLMSMRKTDEQKLREEGMEFQNRVLKEQWKMQKKQNKLLDLQIQQAELQMMQPQPQQIPGQEGEKPKMIPETIEGEEAKEEEKQTDFKRVSEMSLEECIKDRYAKIRATHPELSEAEAMKMAKERCTNRPTSFNQDFWKSIHIENHLYFPYSDRRG